MISSFLGLALSPRVTVFPFTFTKPFCISSSAFLREAIPASAIIFCILISSLEAKLIPLFFIFLSSEKFFKKSFFVNNCLTFFLCDKVGTAYYFTIYPKNNFPFSFAFSYRCINKSWQYNF